MAKSDIEEVLRNWIKQATTPPGTLAPGVDPAFWVTERFVAWWRTQVDDSLGSAEIAAASLRDELTRLDDPVRLGEALHELTHVQDALADLRSDLGLTESEASG